MGAAGQRASSDIELSSNLPLAGTQRIGGDSHHGAHCPRTIMATLGTAARGLRCPDPGNGAAAEGTLFRPVRQAVCGFSLEHAVVVQVHKGSLVGHGEAGGRARGGEGGALANGCSLWKLGNLPSAVRIGRWCFSGNSPSCSPDVCSAGLERRVPLPRGVPTQTKSISSNAPHTTGLLRARGRWCRTLCLQQRRLPLLRPGTLLRPRARRWPSSAGHSTT